MLRWLPDNLEPSRAFPAPFVRYPPILRIRVPDLPKPEPNLPEQASGVLLDVGAPPEQVAERPISVPTLRKRVSDLRKPVANLPKRVSDLPKPVPDALQSAQNGPEYAVRDVEERHLNERY